MRLEAKVLEAGSVSSVLVPLSTFIEFKAENGHSVNAAILAVRDPEKSDDFTDWEPWVVWHAHTTRNGETRPFDEWLDAIEWVGVYEAEDALDPSGGEENQAQTSSPDSSSGQDAGPTSLGSTRTSKPRSGTKSQAA